MNSIKLLKLGVALAFTEDTVLPPFTGNTLRGSFGAALSGCKAAYDAVFKNESGESAPNPYVVSAAYPGKGGYLKGDVLNFSLLLIGSGCGYADECRDALRNMCLGKLENTRVTEVKTVYERVWSDENADKIPECGELSVRLKTPTELLSSKTALVNLPFDRFIDYLFGRIYLLFGKYGEREFVVPYNLIFRKSLIKSECRLKDIKFKTNGQPIDGLLGSMRYSGNLTRFLPYIDLGSQIHIGKKTTRGCGEYEFVI